MTAHVLWIAEGGTFEVHQDLLGGIAMLAPIADNFDIPGLPQSLVVSFVLCWMGPGGRTVERLEIVAAKAGNYTLVVDEIESCIASIYCLC